MPFTVHEVFVVNYVLDRTASAAIVIHKAHFTLRQSFAFFDFYYPPILFPSFFPICFFIIFIC